MASESTEVQKIDLSVYNSILTQSVKLNISVTEVSNLNEDIANVQIISRIESIQVDKHIVTDGAHLALKTRVRASCILSSR